jgi:hypothetical protein
VAGIVAGAMLLLSFVAHTVLGTREMGRALAATNAPPDLVRGLLVGWVFGGVGMLVFGVLSLRLFLALRRGERESTVPALLIGLAYVGFGLWALAWSGFDPFFTVFIVPGLLLVAAALLARDGVAGRP